MTTFPKTPHNQVKRHPERGHYKQDSIYPILDEALLCHVGFVQNNQPFVIPTLHARQGDEILLHGATTSRLMQHAQAGHPLCITATVVDGLVLARSVFNHSVNYRSVVLFGTGYLIAEDEKMAALEAFTEKLIPGRWADARLPSKNELKATSVVAVKIDLASAKVRSGPPSDSEADLSLPVWAGVIPLKTQALPPETAPDMQSEQTVPDYVKTYVEQTQ
jgi:nitroimidazol reductase NimA-like FMN-containing flavoprotein (pyridoxamine 5'-phosphate oxidase superfamily)